MPHPSPPQFSCFGADINYPQQQKVLRSIKGPPEYAKKVDMQKVNLEVMKQYVMTPLRASAIYILPHHFDEAAASE